MPWSRSSKLPRGTSLYGSLPEQLMDGNSFVSRLRKVLAVRARYRIATSVQVDVPAVSNKALLVMVHLLDSGSIQVTALNFSQTTITETVTSEHLPTGGAVIDMFTDRTIATVDRHALVPDRLGCSSRDVAAHRPRPGRGRRRRTGSARDRHDARRDRAGALAQTAAFALDIERGTRSARPAPSDSRTEGCGRNGR